MKHGINGNSTFVKLVENRVGKSAHKRTTIGLINDCVHLRRAANGFKTSIDRVYKILAQANSSYQA